MLSQSTCHKRQPRKRFPRQVSSSFPNFCFNFIYVFLNLLGDPCTSHTRTCLGLFSQSNSRDRWKFVQHLADNGTWSQLIRRFPWFTSEHVADNEIEIVWTTRSGSRTENENPNFLLQKIGLMCVQHGSTRKTVNQCHSRTHLDEWLAWGGLTCIIEDTYRNGLWAEQHNASRQVVFLFNGINRLWNGNSDDSERLPEHQKRIGLYI